MTLALKVVSAICKDKACADAKTGLHSTNVQEKHSRVDKVVRRGFKNSPWFYISKRL